MYGFYIDEDRRKARRAKWNTVRIISIGFFGVILLGSLLLWLPFSNHQPIRYIDALFTAVTCVCVTGLVTVVPAAQFTVAGKVILLILIQIGGLGIIACVTAFFFLLRRQITVRERMVIQETYNADSIGGIVGMVRRILIGTFTVEGVGALFYAVQFVPEYGLLRGIRYSIFHSVSAFCNAGIDLLGDNSLADYVTNPLLNFTTISLIIASGLGFTVWWDLGKRFKLIFQKKLSFGRFYRTLHLQSKIVLVTTGILLVGGTFLIFLFEYDNPASIGKLTLGQKLMASLFQAVTTRTAGFFTVDQAAFTNGTAMLCLFLMLIGGSPMGTAGGIKTTTLAVLVLSIITNLRGKKDVEVCGRKIRSSYVRSALVVAGMAVSVLFVSLLAFFAVMPDAPFIDVLYELTSAVGTVGLSRGLTSVLNTPAKWIVIFTMYIGRIGPLTLGAAVVSRAQKKSEKVHLAEENIMIG